MITSLKDLSGRIIAYAEWRLVGQSGYETEAGEYVWLNDLWIHEEHRHTHKVNRIIDEIMRIVPQAKYCYFQRKDKNMKLHIFNRSQWERRRHAYDLQIKREI